ncbi:serine/threonine-protein kinase [Streptomyces hygroscopicus]|uniref:serine/threonine-protein kinase n=1 Tax=Streptomyces hygroscopicus TaxID=1912 RepID=UPI001FCB4D42|nr:serine/threonine-protein kinase [Streptomyces hygroscopicus]BDH10310.1 hypothetical protein HOK021_14890 [Streptomyces hygroscopicus]
MERGALIARKYELIERLGRGGMGEVWAARDRDLRRDVAIKFLPRDDGASQELLHRFDREAVAAAQINHPNVVTLHERGVHDGLRFLVMERVDGTQLTERIRDGSPMQLTEALRIAREICAALVAAHRARVVHYDIKPSNVMLTSDGGVKVVDFGIAGFTHTRTAFTVAPSSALSPAGTLEYGAPEQFLDTRGDERSDLYALGSVLFALLAGRPPFTGANGYIVLRRKIDEDAPSLADVRPGLPTSVTRLLTELLHRDPDQRPTNAGTVHARLVQMSSPAAHAGRRPEAGGTLPWPADPTEQDADPSAESHQHHYAPHVPRSLPYWTVAVLGALTLFAVAAVATAAKGIDMNPTQWADNVAKTSSSVAELRSRFWEDTYPWFELQVVSGVALVVCWLSWFSRVRVIAEQLAPGELRHSPGMAVACWFIPGGQCLPAEADR